MSSSCVPPKGCVVVHGHPDPYSPDPDPCRAEGHEDGASECGSLCTCTSGSATSLATSVGSREADALGGPPRAAEGGGSPYFVVFVSPQPSAGEGGGGGCGCGCGCRRRSALAALRASLRTACEFCPWIAGFVVIYYSFYWWGLGPGFSAFLCVVGAHAVVRFVKARGGPQCPAGGLSRREGEPSSEEEGDEEERESREQQARREAIEKLASEKPPSYEAAVVKPPPYDLQYHLTPTQPRSQSIPYEPEKEHVGKVFLTVPQLVVEGTAGSTPEDKDDVFLPSYQDAIRLSFRSDKDPKENEEQE